MMLKLFILCMVVVINASTADAECGGSETWQKTQHNGNTIKLHTGIQSAQACADICRETSGCVVFNWYTSGRCRAKHSLGTHQRPDQSDITSGPPSCPETGGSGGSVIGDPTIYTLDDKKYFFSGLCEYVMMIPCKDSTTPLNETNYYVTALFEKVKINETLMEVVTVYVKPYTVVIRTETVEVTGADNVAHGIKFPYTSADGALSLVEDGCWVEVIASYNFHVRFCRHTGANRELQVVPVEGFEHQTCGLLGSKDGNQADDFRLRSGEILGADRTYDDMLRFFNSWKVEPLCNEVTGDQKK